MKKLFSAVLFFSICLTSISYSQDTVNVYNSKDLVNEGVKLHDQGKYNEAIEIYDKINQNDSSWFLAQVEKTLSLVELKNYEECIIVAREALKYRQDRHPFIYLYLGIALDETGKTEESLKVLDEGIKEFPANQQLNYSKGIILQKKGDLAGAVKSYENSLMANPFHAMSHLKLGYFCAERGYYTQAVMSLAAYIMVSGNDSIKLEVLTYLDKYLSEKNTFEEPEIEGLYDKSFSKTDLILANQVALNKSYKLKSKVDYPVSRQIQALVENLKYNKNSDNFWMKYYVPFYSRIIDEGQLEGFSNMILSAATNEKIKKEVSRHKNEIKEFSTWANGTWLEPYQRVDLPFNINDKKISFIHRDRGRIYAISDNEDEKNNTGNWVYFNENGSVKSEGGFNLKGERHGKWTFYYANGKVSTIIDYMNGKGHGKLLEYNIFGYKSREAKLENGLLNGPDVNFFASGDTASLTQYKEGSANGKGFTRFNNGQTEIKALYVNGKYEGDIKKYYDNGQIEIEVNFKEGLKEGPYKSYFKNGKVKRTETFVKDKSNGLLREYFNNGQLSYEVTMNNDNYTGLYKSWYKNSKLKEEGSYNDKGKLTGTWKNYTKDGSLIIKSEYKNDIIDRYECYDNKGNIIYKAEQKQGRLAFKSFYPEGIIKSEGEFVDGKRQGKWLYYDHYGILEQEEIFKDGLIEEPVKEYYANGAIDKVSRYSGGVREGLSEEFFIDGRVYEKGYFRKDEEAGEWKTYYYNSKPDECKYYKNGKIDGWYEYYNIFGVKERQIYYYDGAIIREQHFDTTGKIYQDKELPGFTGIMATQWQNGNPHFKMEMKNGYMNGDNIWYYINGKTDTEGKMFNGRRHGEWKWFFISGNIKTKGSYIYGKKEGLWIEYFDNGNKDSEALYVDGELEGKYTEYYENGKIFCEGNYEEGEEEGIFRYYTYDGELSYALKYNSGAIMAYSYNGPDGSLKPMTEVKGGTFKMEASFPNGKKSVSCNFKNGLNHGEWISYYSNGKTEKELKYINGSIEGERILYYNTGQIRKKDVYQNRRCNGPYIEYYENGAVKKEMNYTDDEVHGLAKYYDEKGKLTKTRYFYGGELYFENTNP